MQTRPRRMRPQRTPRLRRIRLRLETRFERRSIRHDYQSLRQQLFRRLGLHAFVPRCKRQVHLQQVYKRHRIGLQISPLRPPLHGSIPRPRLGQRQRQTHPQSVRTPRHLLYPKR